MNDHQLGSRLRQQILADLQRGIDRDGRGLQALVGDFCGDDELPLLPALRYLVLSPAFTNALGQTPPLAADTALQLRLQRELEPMFSRTICQRMGVVVGGLLALPEPSVAMAEPPGEQAPRTAPTTSSNSSSKAGSNSGNNAAGCALFVLLGAMAGMLVAGVAGGLIWLVLSTRPLQTGSPGPASPGSTPEPALTPAKPVAPVPLQPAPMPSQQASPELAISTVQQLYEHLSSGNHDAARQLFGPAAADQFDAGFFSQFSEVRVSDLHETGRNGSSINLDGVVTFVYPDGSSQVESRSYTVDTASQPARINASSFGAVLKARS